VVGEAFVVAAQQDGLHGRRHSVAQLATAEHGEQRTVQAIHLLLGVVQSLDQPEIAAAQDFAGGDGEPEGELAHLLEPCPEYRWEDRLRMTPAHGDRHVMGQSPIRSMFSAGCTMVTRVRRSVATGACKASRRWASRSARALAASTVA
jgi:hypothetical protein